MELTIQEACKQPQNFMYIWADENKFLKYVNTKYASIIRTKKANQIKLLKLSAEKYGKTYEEYTSAIREAFVDQWQHTPAEALVILAQGGQIAGKNWAEGVYGVGAIYVNTFSGHNGVTVRETDGHILNNGADVTDESKTVYAVVSKKTVAYQQFATIDGVTYMSQLNKTSKKYYAQSFSTADGTYSAKTGNTISASDNADIWGAILSSVEQFLTWLINLFAGNTTGRETINAANTLPSQTADGFATGEAGFGDVAGILLACVAAGTLIFSGARKKKSN